MLINEDFVLHKLSDEELDGLSSDDIYDIGRYYDTHSLPYESTVKCLLEEFNINYDDLTDFVLNLDVGVCNYAQRSKKQIYISRKDSSLKDNIVINLDDSRDMADVTIQIQINDGFIHEEAYTYDGLEVYRG
jgi:hypothetical protein